MKTKFITLAFVALLNCGLSFAKVWRVNNNPGVNASFTTADAAFSSASVVNGDTIYFEGSNTDYSAGGTYELNKQLTLIGPGYFLGQEFWSSPVQFNPNTAYLSQLYVRSNNVKVLGLKIGDIWLYGLEYGVSSNNCLVNRCLLDNVYFYGTNDNILISQNFIRGSIRNFSSKTVTSLLITNNIVGGGLIFYSADNGAIEYNDFGLTNTSTTFNFSTGTFSFRNNIIKGTSNTIDPTHPNSTFSYNMAEQAGLLPAGNGNVNNIDMTGTNVFLDGSKTSSGDGDSFYQLSASSPAKTAGAGGTAIGAFATATPYKLSGIPAIPTIYALSIPSAISTGNSTQVTFSSKSNQ